MNENELLQAILNKLETIDTRLDGVDARLDKVDARLDRMDARLDGMDTRLDRLEVGQTEIRRDIARLDQKIDTLSGDVGAAMVQLTENVDKEVIKLKILK